MEVADFCAYQPKHDDCKRGRREEIVKLSVEQSTGELEILAKAEAARAAAEAKITEIKELGAVLAYPALAAHRYDICQSIANTYLTTEMKDFEDSFSRGLLSIEQCSEEQEGNLAHEVNAALAQSPPSAVESIKDLHAYTIASLRALANYHQSAIEARQARAQRMAGIDERAILVELELQ